MKKRVNYFVSLAVILSAVLLAAGLVACGKDKPQPPAVDTKEIRLSNAAYSLGLLDEITLTAALSGGLEGTVDWRSESSDVAGVTPTDDGLSAVVTGYKAGQTRIVASVQSGDNTYTAECAITVTASDDVPVIYLPSQSVHVPVGGSFKLNPQAVYKDKTPAAQFTYSSSDSGIAAVSDEGVISIPSGLTQAATADITVSGTALDYSMTPVTVRVTVVDSTEIRIERGAIDLYTLSTDASQKTSETVSPAVYRNNVPVQDAQITVTVDKPGVVEYDSTAGQVSAVGEGAAVVTFSVAGALGEVTTSLNVNVTIPVLDISDTYTVYKNKASVDLTSIDAGELVGGAITGISAVKINGTAGTDAFVRVDSNTVYLDGSLLNHKETKSLVLIDDGKVGYRANVTVISYGISDANDLKAFFEAVPGTSPEKDENIFADEKVELLDDVDCSTLGTWSVPENKKVFDGTFEGNGHTVANLKVSNTGMFCGIGDKGILRNVSFIGVEKNMTGSITAGNLTVGLLLGGDNRGTIQNVFLQGVNNKSAQSINDLISGFMCNNIGKIESCVVIAELPNAAAAAKRGAFGYRQYNTDVSRNVAIVPDAANLDGHTGAFYQTVSGVAPNRYASAQGVIDDSAVLAYYTSDMWDTASGVPVSKAFAELYSESVVIENGATADVCQASNLKLRLNIPTFLCSFSAEGGEGITVDNNGVVAATATATGTATVKVCSPFGSTDAQIQVTARPAIDKTGEGIQGYLEKSGNKQSIDASGAIKTAIGNAAVTGVSMGGGTIQYAFVDDTLTITDKTQLSGLSGVVHLDIYCDNAQVYRFAVFVSDYALATAAELQSYFNGIPTGTTNIGGYVVLTDNIDCAELDDYATWVVPENQKIFAGTLDGRGFMIRNLRTATSSVFYGMSDTAVIRDIAFVNMVKTNVTTAGFEKKEGFLIAGDLHGALENVFIEGVCERDGWNAGLAYATATNKNAIKNVVILVDMPKTSNKFGLGIRDYGKPLENTYVVLDGAPKYFQNTEKTGPLYATVAEMKDSGTAFDTIFTDSCWNTDLGIPMFDAYAQVMKDADVTIGDGATAEIAPGGNLTLTTGIPAKFLTFSLTGASGLSVDASGKVTATAEAMGTAVVKAVSVFDPTKFAEITINVQSA